MTSSSPVSARATPPDTGASSSGRPSRRERGRPPPGRPCSSGSPPRPRAARAAAPSSPSRAASACAALVTMTTSASAPSAASAAEAAARAPSSSRGGAGPLLVDVEDGELEPGAGQVARHRRAHGAEADEADALHRRPQPSSASLAPTTSATAPITSSPSPRRSSASARAAAPSRARRSRPPAARC